MSTLYASWRAKPVCIRYSVPVVPLAVILILFLLPALSLSAVLNIWMDEAYSLETTSGGVLRAFERGLTYELQAPLYFAFLAAWRSIDDSIFFARLFSVLSIAAAVPVLAAFARRFFGTAETVAITAAFALNPFSIWAATEIRVYALGILLSALLMLSFHSAFLERSDTVQRTVHTALFGLLTVISLYTHYYLGFLLPGFLLWLIGTRDRQAIRRFLLCMAAAAIAVLPLVAFLPYQMQIAAMMGKESRMPLWFVKRFYGIVRDFVFPVSWLPQTGRRILLVSLALGFIALIAGRGVRRRPIGGILWSVWLPALALFGLSSVFVGSIFLGARHAFMLFVPSLLCFYSSALFLDRLEDRKRLVLLLAVSAVVLGAAANVIEYRTLAKPGDHLRVAEYIMARERPGQPVLVHPAAAELILKHHYRGSNRLLPVPRPVDTDSWDEAYFAVQDEESLRREIERLLDGATEIWYVSERRVVGKSATVREEPIRRVLEALLASRYERVDYARFHMSDVSLLRRTE